MVCVVLFSSHFCCLWVSKTFRILSRVEFEKQQLTLPSPFAGRGRFVECRRGRRRRFVVSPSPSTVAYPPVSSCLQESPVGFRLSD